MLMPVVHCRRASPVVSSGLGLPSRSRVGGEASAGESCAIPAGGMQLAERKWQSVHVLPCVYRVHVLLTPGGTTCRPCFEATEHETFKPPALLHFRTGSYVTPGAAGDRDGAEGAGEAGRRRTAGARARGAGVLLLCCILHSCQALNHGISFLQVNLLRKSHNLTVS